MNRINQWLGITSLALACSTLIAAPQELTQKERKEVVTSISHLLKENYVFPDTAEKMAQSIQKKLSNNDYRGIDEPDAFARKLTEDLQAISNDKHLRIMFDPRRVAQMREQEANPERGTPQAHLNQMRRDNYGFKEVKILDGNVGYLNLTSFTDARFGGETAVAAMNYLANTDALIIDVRQNGGGSPSMIQLIISYLYGAEPVHLNNFYWRPTDTRTQTWTLPHVPGKRRPDLDVYVLTSQRTFSAAEEFSYDLRHLKRATLVGEVTGGGAHPGGSQVASDRFIIWMPNGRAINPITHSNWEGTGVQPHIKTDANSAFNTAYKQALEKLSNQYSDTSGDVYRWYLQSVNAELNPITLSDTTLASYTGKFGPRELRFENGTLYYQRQGRDKLKLTPIAEDVFTLDGMNDFRVQLVKENGKVVALRGLYDNGQSDETPKDS